MTTPLIEIDDFVAEIEHIKSLQHTVRNFGRPGGEDVFHQAVQQAKREVKSIYEFREFLQEWDLKANMTLTYLPNPDGTTSDVALVRYHEVQSEKLKRVNIWNSRRKVQLERVKELEELPSRLRSMVPRDIRGYNEELSTRMKETEDGLTRAQRAHMSRLRGDFDPHGDNPRYPPRERDRPQQTICERGKLCGMYKRFHTAKGPDELLLNDVSHMKSHFHADDPHPLCSNGSSCAYFQDFQRKEFEVLKRDDVIINHMREVSHHMV